MNKIAILFPTFLRNELAYQTIQSIQPLLNKNIHLFIGDQNLPEKRINQNPNWHFTFYFPLPFDCGLSASWNELVKQAHNYDYCLITADSIEFTSSCKNLEKITDFLKSNKDYGIVGFELLNRQKFEGMLTFIPQQGFCLKQLHPEKEIPIDYNKISFYPCNFVRNFFLSKTKVLLDNPWDEELKLNAHTDFFWRLTNNTNYKVFYTNTVEGKYIEHKPEEYLIYRNRLYHEFKEKLQKKYNITGWIKYIR